MKAKLLTALGFGVGTLVYEVLTSGIGGVEWLRVGFVMAFMFFLSLLLPEKVFNFRGGPTRSSGEASRDR